MNSKRLTICLFLDSTFDQNMPARPEVTEIYGEYLPSFGHKIIWIASSLGNGKEIQGGSFKEVHIYLTPRPLASSLPLKLFNLILYLLRRYRLLTKIFKEEGYDVIQVRNNVFDALLALYIKRKYNIPFVFQYSFPKGVYKAHNSESHYLYYLGKFENFLMKHILRKADLVFPISKWMEKELIKEDIPKSKMMPLPMGVNPQLFSQKKDGSEIRKKNDLNSAQVILYTGTMDKLRQLDIMIRAFSKVRGYKDNVKLLIVGEGDDRSDLEELASKLGIQNDVIFTGQVSYFDVPYFIAAADVCLCPVPPLSIYKVSSPTKLFEYMAMGKAVIANEEIPEQKEVIEESGGGVLVKFEDESFANGIIKLLSNPDKAKEMGKKGHEWVVKNRNYEKLAREIEKKYIELVNNKMVV